MPNELFSANNIIILVFVLVLIIFIAYVIIRQIDSDDSDDEEEYKRGKKKAKKNYVPHQPVHLSKQEIDAVTSDLSNRLKKLEIKGCDCDSNCALPKQVIVGPTTQTAPKQVVAATEIASSIPASIQIPATVPIPMAVSTGSPPTASQMAMGAYVSPGITGAIMAPTPSDAEVNAKTQKAASDGYVDSKGNLIQGFTQLY
jgi:hypothetical protein